MCPVLSNLLAFADQDSSSEKKGAAPSGKAARILRAGYVCDIIRDAHTHPPIFHWVVEDVETNEVLGLGQSHTLAEAEITATSFLDDLRLRRAI
jgi:hypothetical protein